MIETIYHQIYNKICKKVFKNIRIAYPKTNETITCMLCCK